MCLPACRRISYKATLSNCHCIRAHARTHARLPTPQLLKEVVGGESCNQVSPQDGSRSLRVCARTHVECDVCVLFNVCVNLRGSSLFRHSGVLPAAARRVLKSLCAASGFDLRSIPPPTPETEQESGIQGCHASGCPPPK